MSKDCSQGPSLESFVERNDEGNSSSLIVNAAEFNVAALLSNGDKVFFFEIFDKLAAGEGRQFHRHFTKTSIGETTKGKAVVLSISSAEASSR